MVTCLDCMSTGPLMEVKSFSQRTVQGGGEVEGSGGEVEGSGGEVEGSGSIQSTKV